MTWIITGTISAEESDTPQPVEPPRRCGRAPVMPAQQMVCARCYPLSTYDLASADVAACKSLLGVSLPKFGSPRQLASLAARVPDAATRDMFLATVGDAVRVMGACVGRRRRPKV